ncbi:MAG TPA: alpha/beta fold hydrolase [Streptosporangiaceae bacterium]
MFRTVRTSALVALCCVVGGTVVAGCDDSSSGDNLLFGSKSRHAPISGTKKIKVDGRSVNVSCSGRPAKGRPVIVLMAGYGDALTKLAGIQKTLSEKDLVCSYDRLGEGASDKPAGPQTYASTGKILTGVIARVAGGRPVVLAGHSLGGAIAARYAPAHRDRVTGLVLLDATSPTAVADTTRLIPKSAKGLAGEVRAELAAINSGQNQERLKATDSTVRSAGAIPVEVVKHGKKYLSAVPHYGPVLERIWTKGQHEWLPISTRSHYTVAGRSTHYIYVDQPALTVKTIQHVTTQAAK